MHEYSLVEAMLEQVDTIRLAQQADRICSIRVGIGEFAGVEPDLFADAFELLRHESRTESYYMAERETDRNLRNIKPASNQTGSSLSAAGNTLSAAGNTASAADKCRASTPPFTPLATPLATPLGHANPQDRNAWKETDLRMHIIPLEAQCGECQQVFHVEKFHFQCPECEEGKNHLAHF